MLLTIVLILIMFICIALMWTEGMWGNALTLVNVTFAAMIASNWFEPLAGYLDQQVPSLTYVWDFLALWGAFVLAFLLLRAVTDAVSLHKVRFKMPVEVTGRILFAVATAWILVCFTLMTIHTAPLARTALRKSFEPTLMGTSFLGLAPDRYWLAFMHSRSQNALAWGDPKVFDPEGDFILKYAARRQELQAANEKDGTIRVNRR